MASWKDILVDVLTLTDKVSEQNEKLEKLAERTTDVDRRLVRLETMVEIAQKQLPKK